MGKKATVNGFTGGLSMDLNPLTNTKEVLSDAINASLVTGNGDEMILQNDMGNIPIPNTKLPDGYVPIGVKEYGGIAYIALYNPQTGEGQLGTFPSPKSYMINLKLDNIPFGYNSEGKDTPTILDETGLEVTEGKKSEDNTYEIALRTGDQVKNTIIPESGTQLWKAANIFDSSAMKKKMWDLSWVVKTAQGTYQTLPIKPQKDGDNVLYNTTYTGGVGDLILQVSRNKVNQFTCTCSYIQDNQKSDVLNYLSINDIAYDDIKNSNGDILVFISEYVYNCPDGQYPEKTDGTEPIEGWEENYIPSNVINGIEYTVNGNKYYYEHHTGSVTNTYDSTTNQFRIRVASVIELATNDKIINYSAAPVTYNEPQENLRISGQINKDFASTNKLLFNTWNYYFDGTSSILRWGFEDYLLYGQDLKNLNFTCTDITGNNPIVVINIPDQTSYNGVFTTDNLYSNGIKSDQVYLCDISFQLINKEEVFHEYRWLNTSGIYNDVYDNISAENTDSITDFGSDKIIPYNTIPLEVNLYDSNNIYATKETDVEGNPLIRKTTEGSKTLQTNTTNTINLDVSTKGIFGLNSNMFTLDDISKSSQIKQEFSSVDVLPTDIPIQYVGNVTTSEYVKNNSTSYIQNSANLSADTLYSKAGDNNVFLRFQFKNKSAIESTYKSYNGDITFTSFFRPFVIDPFKVKATTCEALMSNYLTFGFELSSDLLPKYYYMDEITFRDRNDSYYNRFMMNRTSIMTEESITDSTGEEHYDWQDDSPATTTDLGATYTQINDDVAQAALENISNNTVITRIQSSVEDSYSRNVLGNPQIITTAKLGGGGLNTLGILTLGAGGILEILTVGLLSGIFLNKKRVRATYEPTQARAKNNAIQAATDFDLLPMYLLQYGNNDILPVISFWGSYNLIDGQTSTDDTTVDENGITVNKTEPKCGIEVKSDGSVVKFRRVVSGLTLNSELNTYGKFLAPFWLNNDVSYTSTNIAYITKWDDKNTAYHTNSTKYIVQNIINAYKNYFVYTQQNITVPGDNIEFIDSENCAYTKDYTENITYNDYKVSLDNELLQINNKSYNDSLNKTLNNEFNTTYNGTPEDVTKQQLRNTGTFKIESTPQNVDWSYIQSSMEDEVSKFESTDAFNYSVLVNPINTDNDTDYSGHTRAEVQESDPNNITRHIFKTAQLETYFTCNNEELDKYNCYILNNGTLSKYDSENGHFMPTYIQLNSLNYTTLLLKTSQNNKNVWYKQGGNLVPNYKNASRGFDNDKFYKRIRYHHNNGDENVWVKYNYLPINLAVADEIINAGRLPSLSPDEGGKIKISTLK